MVYWMEILKATAAAEAGLPVEGCGERGIIVRPRLNFLLTLWRILMIVGKSSFPSRADAHFSNFAVDKIFPVEMH